MRINNNFNVLPFYDSLQKQNSKKWYSFGQHYPLICPNNTILPFQFITDSEVTVSSNIEAVNVHSGKVTNLGVKPSVSKGTQADATYYIVKMVETTISAMPEGLHYLRINTNKGYLYSEEFTFNVNHEECIKIEYWNENTLNFNSGEINFDDDFRFILYIPSTIGKPEYEFEEELTKRLGYKFIESQTSNKIYKFNFLAPEYICDAMRLIRLCDYIKLTTKFDTFNALSFAYEPKWQDNGDLAAVDVEFDTDCIIQKLESFNRRLKESFYNALLADIDEPVLFSNDIVAQYYTEFTTTSYINGKLIRQLEAINEADLGSLENLVLPIDNQADTEQKAKKITLASLKNVLIKLADYVTLSTAQNINGEKNFIGGLKVNGSPIIYDSVNKCWKLQGNLVLTGGITMYADDGTLNLPSIYDGLPIDGTTIYWDTDAAGNRVLKAVGGGGTAESVAWSNITGKPSWIGSSKPTYNYSEIQNTPDLNLYATESWVNTKLGGYLPLNGNASSATKLQTERTIWGQPFDGSGNVSGILNIGTSSVRWHDSNSYSISCPTTSVSARLQYHADDGHIFKTAANTEAITILRGGNVGIGTTSPAYKLDVNGAISTSTELIVNGGKIKYDSTNKCWKLEGDLLVTGGVTMYGNEGTFTPSTIMDAILYDDATLGINSNGQLYVKGGTSGGGLDITALQNYLTSNSYLNVTGGDNRYLKLSGGTVSGHLTVDGYYFKAKEISGIALELSNAQPYIDFHFNNDTGDFTTRLIEDVKGQLTILGRLVVSNGLDVHNTLRVYDATIAKWYNILHEGNYSSYALPLSGGTINVSSGNPYIGYANSGANLGRIGVTTSFEPFFYSSYTGANNTIWHSGNDGSGSGLDADLLDGKHADSFMNFTANTTYVAASMGNDNLSKLAGGDGYIEFWDGAGGWFNGKWGKLIAVSGFEGSLSGNASSATKLQTARTIWGQSFDGTGNVSGVISGVDGISFNSSNAINIDYNSNFVFKYTHLQDWSIQKQNTTKIFIVRNDGNVGINTDSPRCKFSITSVGTGSNPSLGALATVNTVGFGDNAYKTYFWTRGTGNGYIQVGREDGNTTAYNLILQALGGNVGIGTESPGQKLHVEGHIWANGDIAAKTKIHAFGNLIANGNVGIGTENPSAKLHIENNTNTSTGLRLDGGWSGYGFLYNAINIFLNGEHYGGIGVNTVSSAYGSTAAAGTYITNAKSGEYMNFYNEGGTFLKSSLLVNGGITMYSDQRKKTILNHVELSLKQIAEAPLIEHYYNSDDKKTTHVGSIAQYWASMNDWFCKLDSEGYYTMEIQNAALASAISIARELDRYETKTDKAIKKLKKRISELEDEVERLKCA